MSAMRPLELEARDGLVLAFDAAGQGRIAFGHRDWLGPIGLGLRGEPAAVARLEPCQGRDALGTWRGVEIVPARSTLPVRLSARAYAERPLLVFRSEAIAPIEGCASGDFERPVVAWPWLHPDRREAGGLPDGARAVGHLYTEFALPVFSDASLAGFFVVSQPFRPAVVEPLWIATEDGRGLLLAPLDAFHDQIVAVPRGRERAADGVRCGWHGDLDRIPAGFATELSVWAAPGPRRALDAWGAELRARAGTRAPGRYADATLSHLSYWTDNGAAYWYRSEPGLDVATTLERTVSDLRERGMPVRCVQLDSWFYPHQQTRPFGAGGGDVPPTGCMAWEPRQDVLPEGIPALRRRLSDAPLILHGRHFSSRSPYFERHAAWLDRDRAHPVGPELFDELLAQAADWGAVQYEQDWLVESYLGVRGLREEPGRARDWQAALASAAARHGLTLQWCMATPPDFMQAVEFPNVTSIRTSGDYRYRLGSAFLWAWFLFGGALARALGLLPYKDVFFSSREGAGADGDPHAEVEALLAALSAGPVGIGDRLGRADPELVLRTCRADGVLVKPDAPLAALERCYWTRGSLAPAPLLAETFSQHPAGRTVYLVALHTGQGGALRERVPLAELSLAGPVLCWDWRRGEAARIEPGGAVELELAPLAWDYRILCPLLPGGIAVVGDPARYASAGDRRLRAVRAVPGGVAFSVLGTPGERVEIAGWSEGPLELVEARGGEVHERLPNASADARLDRDPACGVFRVQLALSRRGRVDVRLGA